MKEAGHPPIDWAPSDSSGCIQTTVPKMKSTVDAWRDTANELLLEVIASTGLTLYAAGASAHAEDDPDGGDYSLLDDVSRCVGAPPSTSTDHVFERFCRHISKNLYAPPSAVTLQKRLVDLKTKLLLQTKGILLEMGASFGPCLAADVWTSKARRSYYGMYLHFISKNWELVGLPLGLARLVGEVEYTEYTPKSTSKNPNPAPVVVASVGANHSAEQLVEHAEAALKQFEINYRGCAGGDTCAHASPLHTTETTMHLMHAMVTDSGGADPRAAALCACNACRCMPHVINTCYKH